MWGTVDLSTDDDHFVQYLQCWKDPCPAVWGRNYRLLCYVFTIKNNAYKLTCMWSAHHHNNAPSNENHRVTDNALTGVITLYMRHSYIYYFFPRNQHTWEIVETWWMIKNDQTPFKNGLCKDDAKQILHKIDKSNTFLAKTMPYTKRRKCNKPESHPSKEEIWWYAS